MKIRVCDLFATCLSQKGIKKVFMVSGGGLIFLTDGLQNCKDLETICCHHEQAAAMSAIGYARYSGLGCAYVTTGCGGTNAITGVLNAWQDSVPCIFISGQCKRKETIRYRKLSIRQLGVQEADIVSIVHSITKYAVMLDDPETALYELEKACYLAQEGRPGPVWIDVPLDIQSACVETDTLKHFVPPEQCKATIDLAELKEDLVKAERPVIIAGGGIRSSGTRDAFKKFVETYQIPFVCSRMGTDVLPTMHPLNIGRIGNKGVRSANLALQNADLVLVIGSRLSVSSTGHEYRYFARGAKVYAIDIDLEEHMKQTVHIEHLYHMDLRCFFDAMSDLPMIEIRNWAAKCLYWREKYQVCLEEYYQSKLVNVYAFIEELSKQLYHDAIVVTDTGSALFSLPQALKTTDMRQRFIASGAQAEMGFALPAAIGVSAAGDGREVLAVTGDGSLQMNIQEFQTLKHYSFLVKLFVWNNNGYLSIRATQNKLCGGRKIGTDASNGVSFPDLEKIALAYGLQYVQISSTDEISEKIHDVLRYKEPVVCEVMCIPDQPIVPSVESRQLPNGTLVSCPLEDMSPFLPRDEFLTEMIIDPVQN